MLLLTWIRKVYKVWPILGPESVVVARIALAARRQGRFRPPPTLQQADEAREINEYFLIALRPSRYDACASDDVLCESRPTDGWGNHAERERS